MKKDMKQLLWITGVSAVLTAGVMAAALLLLASCTQDDGAASGTGSDPNLRVPLTVSTVSLAGGGGNADTRTSTDTRTHADTRAASLPVPVISGKLGVCVRAGNGYDAQSLTYTYTDGAWATPTPPMLSTAPVSLYAYYPQDGGSHSVAAGGSVALTTRPYSAASDFAYTTGGGENVCSTHPYAGFVLRHAYARIKVDIEFSNFFDAATTLDAVTLAATGFLQSGTLNINTNASTAGTTVDKLEWKPALTLTTLGYKYLGDLLVVPPGSTLSGTKLTITIDGTNWNADLSGALTRVEAGKSYRIRAVMGAALIIDGVTIEGWNDGGSSNADSDFETGIPPVIDNVTNEGWTDNNAGSGNTLFD